MLDQLQRRGGGVADKNMSNHQTRREISSHEWYTQRRAFSATNYWWLSFYNAQIKQFESDFHVRLCNNEGKLRLWLLLVLTALTLVWQHWEILAVCCLVGWTWAIPAFPCRRCTLRETAKCVQLGRETIFACDPMNEIIRWTYKKLAGIRFLYFVLSVHEHSKRWGWRLFTADAWMQLLLSCCITIVTTNDIFRGDSDS